MGAAGSAINSNKGIGPALEIYSRYAKVVDAEDREALDAEEQRALDFLLSKMGFSNAWRERSNKTFNRKAERAFT